MQTAVACPKCSYVRQPTDAAPAWQCPSCGIAYVKWQQVKQLVVPPKAGEPAPALHFDGSIWLLLAVNIAALGVAEWQGWSAGQLVLMYWVQSIAIGASYVLRIRSLEKFSTEGMVSDEGLRVQPTPETKALYLFGFIALYGLLHLGYLVFVLGIPRTPLRLDLWFWLCTAAFALNHYWSYRYNRELDRRGAPHLETLVYTPFVRIAPMHLIFATGIAFVVDSVLPFGVLKIAADVTMHVVEHQQLQKTREGDG